jgi:release factor glutamine methyltransferase
VLDLCCGSGCLAVAIAHEVPGSVVVASDASLPALEVAGDNAGRLVPGRIAFRHGDLFAAVGADAPFDLIVSNPPYVADGELADVDPEVRDHEPESAWLAGPDPIAFHRRILGEGGRFVAPDGAIMMELGSGSAEAAAVARARFGGAKVWLLDDLAGRPRVLVADLSA